MSDQSKISPFIVDVREPHEFADSHVEGAVNIPLSQLNASRLLEYGVAPDQAVVVYCRSGGRAGQACQILDQAGYKRVLNGINQTTVEQEHL